MIKSSLIQSVRGAAGTLLGGIMLSGDDAPQWLAAGVPCERVCVQCSARIVAGEYPAPTGMVRVAIDRNGASCARVARIIGAAVEPATGVYDGALSGACVATVDASAIPAMHAALSAQLDGFGCFAVLSAER